MDEGRQVEGGAAKGWAVAYLVIVLGALAALFVLAPVGQGDPEAELQELAPAPALIEDGHPNVGVLADAGDWFDDHFAFRQQLITANARVQAALFGVSATDQVVIGRDGWLYYTGTMADYQRTRVMGAAMARNAAFNLSLMQSYVESKGARFAVAVAPDKNSLYPEWMPYWRPAGEGESSLDVFRAAAEEAGVNLVDLHAALEDAGDVLYMRTDTHWDGAGAHVGYDAIMAGLGLEPRPFDGRTDTDPTFVGDLEAMLYPADPTPEPLTMPAEALDYRFVGDGAADGTGDDVEDAYLLTESTAPEAGAVVADAAPPDSASPEAATPDTLHSLLMYRDSFGNVLLPYMASTFSRACFSKLEPYDLSQLEANDADAVVVERAERHLDFFATDPPAQPAPALSSAALVDAPDATTASATIEAEENGPYLQIDGLTSGLDPLAVRRIGVVVDTPSGERRAYLAFRRSVEVEGGYDDGGYRLYIPKTALGLGDERTSAEAIAATVVAETDAGAVTLANTDLLEALT